MWRHQKLLDIDNMVGYRATKQIQAEIDGLRAGYEQATIKVAHLWKILQKQQSLPFYFIRMRQIFNSDPFPLF